ncbi:protein SET DOMAIN GROUP 41 [Dioscorea cayenensis subsp. rotundata]|uniref:Protein SET DOMAIN GROUP 41 n=1 Tax=Dioscorea cayennensis subsp. rotundata TaxID=55577 RepID=A0AB40CJ07_DIOCR|nr:protein SET DOMAIN GROUP 41 [Dioscorea cayenensis subsp. rotundata]
MELRARENLGRAQDLSPPVPPVAAALHGSFLSSNCSSCFRLLSSRNTPPYLILFPSCPSCNASILYCSPSCSASDSPLHVSSGECRLLSTSPHSCTSDLRLALRLLHSLGSDPLPTPPARIGGLLASDLDDEGEIAERIREGATLMARARNGKLEGDIDTTAEKAALWAVLRNAVEVQVGGSAAAGVAIYGPMFSWFNHSCSPNACYRFEFSSRSEPEPGSLEPGSLRVFPFGPEQDADAWKAWLCSESQLLNGLCGDGPQVIVRSIKPIKKDEEVCITYVDLLQPKVARHADLWSKYRFVCACVRCSASPQQYVDRVISSDLRTLNSCDDDVDTKLKELADFLDQVIDKYLEDGNSQVCCEMVESMLLSESFGDKHKFKLHPFHHLSLSAYISLSSTYKVLANDFAEVNISLNFKMSRAAASYALLLAGATNHLLLSDVSLIANATLFWINAGEAILDLVKSLKWESDKAEYCINVTSPSASWNEFEETSVWCSNRISGTLINTWPFLVEGFPFLEKIEHPLNFTWLGLPKSGGEVDDPNSRKLDLHFESQFKASVVTIEPERRNLFQVATLCLYYGRYLASICYGPKSYLLDHINHLLLNA